MSKVILELTCRDCTYEDPMGCFDGVPEERECDSLEEAIKKGEQITRNGVLEYRLLNFETKKELTKEEINPTFHKLYGYDYA